MIVMRLFFAALLGVLLVSAPVAPSYAAADHAAPATEEHAVQHGHDGAGGPAFDTAEAENPVAAAEDHGGGGLPQLNIKTYPSQIFWLLVMFAALYITFSKSVLPTIGSVVGARDALIKGNLDQAQLLKEQAEQIRAAYEKNLESARAQAVQAVQDVENAAKKKAADQVDVFRTKSAKEIEAAEARVESAKDKALGDMTSVAAEVASLAAEKITGLSTDRQKAHAIVETIAGKAKAA